MACFNATPELAANFKFLKSKGQGEFTVKYMLAAFNKEAESGEFFIEFDEYVWENKLMESFRSQGAGQVTAITFTHNDGGDSAANALARIMTSQKKTGDGYTRGTCPPALSSKVHAKMEEAHRQEQMAAREFDEKTTAAIKLSLDGIDQGVQKQAVELMGIKQGVQSQGAELVDIKHGVCHVIPDYQNEIKYLQETLAKKTAACDTIEGKLAYKTRLMNQQDAYIIKMEEQQKELMDKIRVLNRIISNHEEKIAIFQEQLDMSKHLYQVLEKAQHTAETLASALAEERALKRQRA